MFGLRAGLEERGEEGGEAGDCWVGRCVRSDDCVVLPRIIS